jgi:hypothetical protein
MSEYINGGLLIAAIGVLLRLDRQISRIGYRLDEHIKYCVHFSEVEDHNRANRSHQRPTIPLDR